MIQNFYKNYANPYRTSAQDLAWRICKENLSYADYFQLTTLNRVCEGQLSTWLDLELPRGMSSESVFKEVQLRREVSPWMWAEPSHKLGLNKKENVSWAPAAMWWAASHAYRHAFYGHDRLGALKLWATITPFLQGLFGHSDEERDFNRSLSQKRITCSPSLANSCLNEIHKLKRVLHVNFYIQRRII